MTTVSKVFRVALALTIAAPLVQSSRLVPVVSAPFERLIENAEARLRDTPGDPYGYYLLGRIHALRFALDASRLATTGPVLAEIQPLSVQKHVRQERCPRMPEDVLGDLRSGLEWLIRAVDCDPMNSQYHLALASLYAAGAHLAQFTDQSIVTRDPYWNWGLSSQPTRLTDSESQGLNWRSRVAMLASLRRRSASARERAQSLQGVRISHDPVVNSEIRSTLEASWNELAFVHYYFAYELSLLDGLPSAIVSYRGGLQHVMEWECVEALAAMSSKLTLEAMAIDPQSLAIELASTHRHLLRVEVGTPMSPIILPLGGSRSLDECLDRNACVAFDISAVAPGSRWSWVTPDAGMLVWDPASCGAVNDGSCLIGEATWRLFARNGFDVLDLLDDDRNGWLESDELVGIRVWRDGDRDGVSASNEVADLTCFGVRALRCTFSVVSSRCLEAEHGAQLIDGGTVPLFDWFSVACAESM